MRTVDEIRAIATQDCIAGRLPCGSTYYVDHEDGSVFLVSVWANVPRDQAVWTVDAFRRGQAADWRDHYMAAVDPSRANSTFHFPRKP